MARVQARVLLGDRTGRTGVGLLLMGGLTASSSWTALLPGFLVAGRRGRPAQPGDRRRGRSASCPRSAAAWRRGSTTRSARSASPSASRPGERSSSATGPTRSSRWPRARPRPPAITPASCWRPSRPATLHTAVASFPAGGRAGAVDAARAGFLAGMNEILMLGGILAFAGAAGGPVAGPREGHRARRAAGRGRGPRGRARGRARVRVDPITTASRGGAGP